jgi:sec-independent protein translocase protein TatB
MEIFNIHIFEFLLIAGLALVVFGPEKLPDVGRFIGRQLAKFLAWQQQSPEMRMLTEVRSDFEKEIASLRDELVRTRAQLDVQKDLKAVTADVQKPLDDVAKTIGKAGKIESPASAQAAAAAKSSETPTGAAPEEVKPADPQPAVAADPSPQPVVTPEQPSPPVPSVEDNGIPAVADTAQATVNGDTLTVRPSAQSVPANAPTARTPAANGDTANPPAARPKPPQRPDLHGRPDYEDAPRPKQQPDAVATSTSAVATEQARLAQQYETIIADLQALALALREQGVLSQDWNLPSQVRDQEIVHRD